MAKPIKTFYRKKPDGTRYPGRCVDIVYRGRRISGNTGAETKAGVEQWVKARKAEIDRELEALQQSTVLLSNMTVGMALDRYFQEHLQFQVRQDRGPVKEERARRGHAQRLLRIGSEIGTDVKLEDLNTAMVSAAVARRLAAGQNPKTVKRDLVTPLKAMHNMARDRWEHRVKAINWREILRPLRAPKRVITLPTEEELVRLVNMATPRLRRVIRFALATGFRLDEIAQASWDRFRPPANGQPATLTVIGKGNKEERLPLNSAATSLVLSTPRGESSLIFDMTNFQREWRRARSLAGLPRTRFHDLRHVFATWLQHAVKDPTALQAAMRHSDISTSLIYVHADKSELLPSLEVVATKLSALPLPSPHSSQSESEEPEQLSFDFQ